MSNRRQFLRACAGVSATAMAASMSRLGVVDAFAQHHHRERLQLATDYRALVCIFLDGGNDSWNTIVNMTSTEPTPASAARSPFPRTSC